MEKVNTFSLTSKTVFVLISDKKTFLQYDFLQKHRNIDILYNPIERRELLNVKDKFLQYRKEMIKNMLDDEYISDEKFFKDYNYTRHIDYSKYLNENDIELLHRLDIDIDLNKKAFEKIEPLVTGRMPIRWQIVPLPTKAPIQYVYKPQSTPYWMQVQVRNHRYPIKKLEYKDTSGKFIELPREEYNYFTLNNPGNGPFSFRVTDIYGHVLIDQNIPLNPSTAINGAANFPY